MAWPNFHLTDGRRGRLTGGSTGCKRERPTCTERKTAHRECGWKDGDSGDSAGESLCPTKKQQNPLDSDWPSHGRPIHSNPGGGTMSDMVQSESLFPTF